MKSALSANVLVVDAHLHRLACTKFQGSRLIGFANEPKRARYVSESSGGKLPRHTSEKDRPVQLVDQVSTLSRERTGVWIVFHDRTSSTKRQSL
jgi:hypothetical protein